MLSEFDSVVMFTNRTAFTCKILLKVFRLCGTCNERRQRRYDKIFRYGIRFCFQISEIE